ncbi:cytochrome c family protein [candidate division KSB1 bacterium]|nr:cytochrome c family protein [candidate division KSB1 bacterium]
MKRSALILSMMLIFIMALSLGVFAQADKAQYVGSAKCKMCHSSKARGNSYGIWAESKHAKAFETLGTEESKAIAKKLGINEDPQKADKCLKCHVTAYNVSASDKAASFKQEEGVGCEVCHGPGSLYMPMKVMKALAAGKQDAKAVAYNKGDKTKCVKCHNEDSPTYKPFKLEEAWEIIAHEVPKAQK